MISGHKLEYVKAATNRLAWYQLYLVGGREAAEGAVERACTAGFSALAGEICDDVDRLALHPGKLERADHY
jgi:hypothetical protein